MKQKKCITCGDTKPVSEYYAHPQMADGYLGRCKLCHRAAMRRVREENIERIREYDRQRGREPARKKAYAEKLKKLRGRPHVMDAHNMVARAIRRGEITRPDFCQNCEIECKPQAHHDDHSRPLDIMWLCPICHAARHRELGRIRTVDAQPPHNHIPDATKKVDQ